MSDAAEDPRDPQRRINFETYVYDSGEVANRFTGALERAARRGVRVTRAFLELFRRSLLTERAAGGVRRSPQLGCFCEPTSPVEVEAEEGRCYRYRARSATFRRFA